jgi:hypothetical protein
LISIKAVEVLDGLQKWYHSVGKLVTNKLAGSATDRKILSLLLVPDQVKKWFAIASMFASGHVESAIHEYKKFRASIDNCSYASECVETLDNHAINYLASVEDYESIKDLFQRGKQNVDTFGIDILNDMLKTYLLGSKSEATPHNQLSASSFEIWIEHMNIQQCILFARLKQFRDHVISVIAGPSIPVSLELEHVVSELLCNKLAVAVQADNYLKWNAQTEMSLLSQDASDKANSLSSWVSNFDHRFKRSDLEQIHNDPTHWARLGYSLRTMYDTYSQNLIDTQAWIDASVITARVCRWNKNITEANSIIDTILKQNPSCSQALFEKAKLIEISQEYIKAAAIYGKLVNTSSSPDPGLTQDMRARAVIAMTKLCKRRNLQAACTLLQEFNSNIICHNETDYSIAIADLYESACQFAPEWPKAWFLYGTHCYRYGWQLLEDIKTRRGAIQITQEAVQNVHNIVQQELERKHSAKDVAVVRSLFLISSHWKQNLTFINIDSSVIFSRIYLNAGTWMMRLDQYISQRISEQHIPLFPIQPSPLWCRALRKYSPL